MVDRLSLPKPVQLDPPGPYILPIAEAFFHLGLAGGELPVQIRYQDQRGTEVHLPASEKFLEKLFEQLKVHFSPRRAAAG